MPASTITLNDGNKVPRIAFGTGSALYNKDATQGITLAIQNGFTHLDGAQVYQNEGSVGAGIVASGKPRSELFITTKLASLGPGETPKSRLEESLKKFGLDYVDLYLIHQPRRNHEGRLKEVWKGMEEAKEAGLARSIGVSNFTADNLKDILEVATVYPAVNQVEAHPYVWKALEPNFPIHKEYGIVTASYGGLSPIFRGEGGPLNPVIERVRARLENTRGSPVSDSQVLIKWLQQKGVLVVTTSSKAERIREYLDAENIPDLTSEEIQLIETTGAKHHKRFYPHEWIPE